MKKIFKEVRDIVNKFFEEKLDKSALLFFGPIFLFCTPFFIFSCIDQKMFGIIFLGYFSIFSLLISIVVLLNQLYISNKNRKINKGSINFHKVLYAISISALGIFSIPLLIFGKIVEKIVSKNAKKASNLYNWLCIIFFEFILILCILRYIEDISDIVTQYISNILPFSTDNDFLFFFVFVFIIKEIMDFTNWLVIKFLKVYGTHKIKNDPEKIIEMEDDLLYIKFSCWKAQLSLLIILFVVVSSIDPKVYPFQSESVNAITLFTLVILYKDKSKEWKERRKKELEARRVKKMEKPEQKK